jgi:ubiquinone/menaquinone biosynthesis C-methylase UbiE
MAKLLQPKGDRYYGRAARAYNAKREKQDWWHVEHEEMRDLLAGLPKNLNVVDIPFGTGRFAPLYKECGHKISGLDISDHMITAAKRALGDDFEACRTEVGSALSTPFHGQEFDLLVSTRFLSHIISYKDARAALTEFARITKTYAIIQLGQTTAAPRTPAEDEAMACFMAPEAVDDLLRTHGFEPVERRLVVANPETSNEIFHILCGRTA